MSQDLTGGWSTLAQVPDDNDPNVTHNIDKTSTKEPRP